MCSFWSSAVEYECYIHSQSTRWAGGFNKRECWSAERRLWCSRAHGLHADDDECVLASPAVLIAAASSAASAERHVVSAMRAASHSRRSCATSFLVLALPPHWSRILLHGANRDLVDRCGSGASVGVGVVRLVTPRRGTAQVRKEVVHDALCCLGALPARGQRAALVERRALL